MDKLAIVISGIAASISLVALWHSLWKTRQTRSLLLRSAWDQARDQRSEFWPILRSTYKSFLSGRSDNWPQDIDTLINAAGCPPNVPVCKGLQVRNWVDDNSSILNPAQRMMCEFAVAIYPPRSEGVVDFMQDSRVAKGERKIFDKARRGFATFFQSQRESFSNRRLYKVAGHAATDVIVLAWLELALARGTKDARPGKEGYQGKWGLFEFCNYLCQRRTR